MQKRKKVKKFTATELRQAARQLGAKGGRATAKKARAKVKAKYRKVRGSGIKTSKR